MQNLSYINQLLLIFLQVTLCLALDTLPMFVNINIRRYCRTGWPKMYFKFLFISSPNVDGFHWFFHF